jgi:hypothetical protein
MAAAAVHCGFVARGVRQITEIGPAVARRHAWILKDAPRRACNDDGVPPSIDTEVIMRGSGIASQPMLAAAFAALLGMVAILPARATGIPNQIASAIAIDKVNHTITLPLFRGQAPGGGRVYFILTESSDFNDAVRRGTNWSPKLRNALGTAAVQYAHVSRLHGEDGSFGDDDGTVHFAGTVDFRGKRLVVPGPDLFPVDPSTHAGPVGDHHYSPLFTTGDGIVYNGQHVANKSGIHPKVISIDTDKMQVTLRLTAGLYLGRNVLYLSTEASVTQIAALENATFAPNLATAPQAGSDDPGISAREAIIPVVNGPMGVDNPERQGLRSAVAGEGDPLNIIREEPECSDPKVPANCSALEYSPLWDVHPVVWTAAAIAQGQQRRVTSHQDAEHLFQQGLLVSGAPDGPLNLDPEIFGLRAARVVVNCPPMFVAPPAP